MLDPKVCKAPKWNQVVQTLRAAEFHWHFAQGLRALESGLYLPGVLALVTGVEASIRFTLYKLKSSKFPFEGDLGPVLSNSLLRHARDQGLPVDLLAFAEDVNFLAALNTKKPEVRIVRVRNDLAHGNVQTFINQEFGDTDAFFTPECLRLLSNELEAVVLHWIEGLAVFMKSTP